METGEKKHDHNLKKLDSSYGPERFRSGINKVSGFANMDNRHKMEGVD